VTLTLQGLESYAEVAKEDVEHDDSDSPFNEDEDVELISELEVNNEKFLLVRYMEPFLLIAEEKVKLGSKKGSAKGKSAKNSSSSTTVYELIDSDQEELIAPIVDSLMEAAWPEEYDTDDNDSDDNDAVFEEE
jgi:hypothetical protein